MNLIRVFLVFFIIDIGINNVDAFVPITNSKKITTASLLYSSRAEQSRSMREEKNRNINNRSANNKNKRKTINKSKIKLKDLMNDIQSNPSKYQLEDNTKKKQGGGSKRTRRRVESPKQQYVYASQRRTKQQQQDGGGGDSSSAGATSTTTGMNKNAEISKEISKEAKNLGLVKEAQCCYPVIDDNSMPSILGQIRVGDDDDDNEDGATTMQYAYIINKPAGWTILGGKQQKKKKEQLNKKTAKDSRGEGDTTSSASFDIENMSFFDDEDQDDGVDSFVNDDVFKINEADILALLTPQERIEYEKDRLMNGEDINGEIIIETSDNKGKKKKNRNKKTSSSTPTTRIVSRSKQQQEQCEASLSIPLQRPSIVSWLKDTKAKEGMPIRGGKYWKAIAGATDIDDSGLVLICPKDKVSNVFVDQTTYNAVVGNGKYMTPVSKKDQMPKEFITNIDIISKLRKSRGVDDVVLTVEITCQEQLSTCTNMIHTCQEQFQDGIRGDYNANPFDRRSPRRLIHCKSMSVSSLVSDDDTVTTETTTLPDDIRILSDRRNHHTFVKGTGSFLGRTELRNNNMTNAYREINSAADGYVGWIVDRYDKWLLVQEYNDGDQQHMQKGPLPSIHDGNTLGIYYLPSKRNRNELVSEDNIRSPILIEGQGVPSSRKPTTTKNSNDNDDDDGRFVPIIENGIKYLVSLDKDLSTGIFLDQRVQRSWINQICNDETKILNCFAHCGAFSVAAAKAGSKTVSLDLEQKWLSRIPKQLKFNGIEHYDDPSHHDCIYGDCFDWLSRLSKRGEKYDIVILDPPSTSIGTKKRRWSVKNDMSSLVSLAAPLVKNGGYLLTITNSVSISPLKFVRMCKKGLDDAFVESSSTNLQSKNNKYYKLERVVPMPVDFPSIGGSQDVKNLVWKIL